MLDKLLSNSNFCSTLFWHAVNTFNLFKWTHHLSNKFVENKIYQTKVGQKCKPFFWRQHLTITTWAELAWSEMRFRLATLFILILVYFISFAQTVITNNDKQERIQYGQGDCDSLRQLHCGSNSCLLFSSAFSRLSDSRTGRIITMQMHATYPQIFYLQSRFLVLH